MHMPAYNLENHKYQDSYSYPVKIEKKKNVCKVNINVRLKQMFNIYSAKSIGYKN